MALDAIAQLRTTLIFAQVREDEDEANSIVPAGNLPHPGTDGMSSTPYKNGSIAVASLRGQQNPLH